MHWIEAAQNYVCLHAGEHYGLLRQTMNSLEKSLRAAHFVRIHRGLLVSLGVLLAAASRAQRPS